MMREWMTRQMEANEDIKNQVVELENRINQGLRNHQGIIQNLERQFEYLEKIQPSESFPHAVLLNHVGDKELNSIDGIGIRVLTKKEIKKDDMGLPKEPNKEWNLNEKVISYNK
ncbi:hypothetical protein Tco_1068280 [Tanacetum coccineum]|uniref:Uncharacterized protein n=1 Tax=Tanacetum coccineum TaxID=301880 RepID=A0ABQ5HF95_9ASTR